MHGTICEVDPTFLANAISYSKDVQSQRRNIEKKLASVQSNEFFIRFFIVLREKDLLDFNLQKLAMLWCENFVLLFQLQNEKMKFLKSCSEIVRKMWKK